MPRPTARSGDALLSVFAHLYIINLPERRDRRAGMQRQLERLGLSLEHPQVTLFPALRPADRGAFPTIGTRGCYLSHLGVLRAALQAGHPRFLVMEDDADFAADIAARLPDLAAALAARPWDIFYGWHPDSYGRPGGAGGGARGLIPVPPEREVTLMHFVGWRREAAARALPCLAAIAERPLGDPRGGAMHVDGALAWFRKAHPDLVTLAPAEPLAVQRPSRSDIHALRWFDRLSALRPVLALLRRLKGAAGQWRARRFGSGTGS